MSYSNRRNLMNPMADFLLRFFALRPLRDCVYISGYINILVPSCKVSVAIVSAADICCPSEHETVAPERSAGVLVDVVEVSGDLDVRLKWYTTPVLRFLATISCPIGSSGR